MKQSNYVPTSLGTFLNENNRSIMLTRKYGEKTPVVVGSRAPLRNQVLSFVAENAKVTRLTLKKFISGLNETTSNPAATNMWLKRNEKFFIVENRAGIVSYKLSKLGERLLNTISPLSETQYSKGSEIKSRINTKKLDPKKDMLLDDEDADQDEKLKESRQDRITRIIEGIKEKRNSSKLYEDEELEDDEETEDDKEELEDDEESEEESEEEYEEESEEESEEETDDNEEDDRVEITEFIITVDDVASAIAELQELGIDASEVSGSVETEDDQFDDVEVEDNDVEVEDNDDEVEVGDESTGDMEDFDLEIGGDIEGEEPQENTDDLEESSTEETTEDSDDEFTMDDLDAVEDDGENQEVDGQSEEIEQVDNENPEETEEIESEDAPISSGSQIKVSADNWEKLKGWLESKGVDIEEMFGGQIEVEGEEGVEDEINFDDLEELPTDEDESNEHESEETEEEEDKEEEEGDDDKESEEKPKGGFQPGKKGVNPFPKK